MAHTTKKQAETCVRRYLDDIWTKADLAACDEVLTDDFAFVLTFNRTDGVDAFKALLQANHSAFENLTYTMIDDEFVTDGDKASVHWAMHSTAHRATWNNIEPTGNESATTGMTFFRFRSGKIKEAVVVSDVHTLLRHLGVIQ